VWADRDEIEFIKTDGGHRRYKLPTEPTSEFGNYIYARVSSKKQDGDLQRQIEFLKKLYPDYEVIQDIGSGLNFKRQGFRKILEQLFKGNIREVVVSSSDRFSRFGARDLFGWLFENFGGKLTFLNNKEYKNPNEELSEDLLEIITVFSARYHGRRSYTNNKESADLSKQTSENTI
jgi:predicted site-specific integrase-resolvase